MDQKGGSYIILNSCLIVDSGSNKGFACCQFQRRPTLRPKKYFLFSAAYFVGLVHGLCPLFSGLSVGAGRATGGKTNSAKRVHSSFPRVLIRFVWISNDSQSHLKSRWLDAYPANAQYCFTYYGCIGQLLHPCFRVEQRMCRLSVVPCWDVTSIGQQPK